MKKNLKPLCLIVALFLITGARAQLSGTYNVPTTFTSVAAAISSLNIAGVSGAVTIEVTAAYTETVTTGGFTLNAITGASSANTITFMKTGSGANPVLVAYGSGTAVPSDDLQDGVWKFVGSDYITIDGIDINDPNTSNPATMEFGYGFFKASATDGCQNNTIKNCHITLNRDNNDFGSSPASDGSRGIDVVNAMVNTHTTAVTVTSASGANSNNKFYSNIIENCNIGIAIAGYADTTPFAFADAGNDIGGSSALTGNTFINFGGAVSASAPAAGVRTERQYGINVRYNTINSNNGSGVDHQSDLRGIYLTSAQSANATISNNTITLSSGASNGESLIGIQNASGSTAASNSITITNNLITNCTYSSAVDGTFYGLYNSASAAYLNISNNILSNNSSDDTGYGTFFDIYNSGGVTTTISITNNLIDVGNFNGSGNSIYPSAIYNSGGGTSSILNILTNTLQNVNFNGTTGTDQDIDLITNSGRRGTLNISGNNFSNISVNSVGYVSLIHNTSTTRNVNVNNNNITTGFAANTNGYVYGYRVDNSPSSGTANVTGNTFSNVTLTGQGTFWGISHSAGTSQVANVSNNTISNINGGANGWVVGIQESYGNTGSSVTGNTLTTFSGYNVYGMLLAYDGDGNTNVSNNAMNSYTAVGSDGEAMGILNFGGLTTTISKNKIYNISGTGTVNVVSGIYILGGSTVTVVDNLVGDLKAPSSTGQAVSGIYIDSPTNANVYYNTINISGTSSGSGFSSMGLYSTDSPVLDLRNNIIVNTSTATGTGGTYAYYRGSSDLTNMALTSNNNLFYAGTPSSSNLLYYDGTNSSQTIGAYKILMGLRETFAVTENPPFITTTGSAANYLDLSTSVITLAESGALPIAGITTDFGGTTRNATTPDIGAWEGTYLPFICTTAVGGTLASSAVNACIGQTVMASSNGVSFGIGTTYTWKVGATAGGPYAPIGGGTGSNTPNYTSDPLAIGVYYVVLETACPALSLTAMSNEGTLSVFGLPTATAAVNISTLCAGQSFSLVGSGSGTTYMWMGPNGYTSTTQSPLLATADATSSGTYSLMVSDAHCTSTVVTASVKVYPYPATPTITPASASICPGGSATLTATGVVSASPTLEVGTQESQNTNSGSSAYPAPYTAYYGGQKMQILVLASELYAAGFVAGSPLTSIQFPVVSLESNWGGSITENQNFQVNIGTTSLTSLSNFEMSLTNVVAPSNYTPTVGYTNTHTFSSPFVWNGSENVVIETSFSNNFPGTSSDAVIQYNSSTSFQSTIVYRADSETALSIASETNVSVSFNSRPDFKLNGTSIGSMVWSPLAGLTGVTDHSVIASPAATSVYSLTASLGGCATTASVTINVMAVPVLTVAASAASVCPGMASTLIVSGAMSYSWNATTTTNTISVNPTSTTVYTVMGQNLNCTAVSETITVTTFSLPLVTAAPSSTAICSGQTATLTANGAATYSWVSGPATSIYQVSPAANTTYSVTGTSADGCTAQSTVSLTVNSGPVVTVAPLTASVCMNSTTSFTATGATTYSWTTGGNTAMETVTVAASGVYTVTGISNGCSTSKTVAVTAFALPVVNVSPATPTICTNESLVLTAGGGSTTYSWTSAAAAGATLNVNPTTTSSYTVMGTDANNCSSKTVITVVVDACTGLGKENKALGNVNLYPNPSTGLITANFGFEGTKEILVLNSVGAKIFETSTNETSTNFDLSNFAKGVYFVNVKSNGSTANYKIVIQ